jgi:hypothetical protein
MSAQLQVATPTVYRLDAAVPEHWAMWGQLEERVRTWTPILAPDIPVDTLLAFIRQRWMQAPDTIRACLVMGEDGYPAGHFLAWLDTYWGIPYLHVHQASLDFPSAYAREQVRELLREWVRDLADRGVTSRHFHWVTERDSAWKAFFGDKAEAIRTTMLLPVDKL